LKTLVRQYAPVSALFLGINVIWLIIFPQFNSGLTLWSLPVLSLFFLLSSSAALLIFFRGFSKNPKDQTFHTFIAVSSKFLAELVITLVWFAVLKKTGFADILLFFLLYLAFTIATLISILKTLKIKDL